MNILIKIKIVNLLHEIPNLNDFEPVMQFFNLAIDQWTALFKALDTLFFVKVKNNPSLRYLF